jgi:hypothetical protein
MANLDDIIASGDRVEFKSYIKSCSLPELTIALAKASRSQVQNFRELVFAEMHSRTITAGKRKETKS